MDDIDRKLMVLISLNPRIHLRELANELGISRQNATHRLKILTDIGVIQSMNAGVSIHYLNAVLVVVFGRFHSKSIQATLNRLGENELTYSAHVAGGNFLYVIGLLRNISELDEYAEFVKRSANIPEPTVGIMSLDPGLAPEYVDGGIRKKSYKSISPLNLRVIASLKDNARRSVTDIARMAGVSAKTVRRHLEEMTSGGLLGFTVPADYPSGGFMLLAVHLTIRDGVDKGDFGKRLLSKSLFQEQYVRTFSNLPGFLIWVFWSGKMTEVREVLRELSEEEEVLDIAPNFIYLERTYTTWRDKLPTVWTTSPKNVREHKLHPDLREQ